MADDTLTGAALVEAVARASGCACRTAPCCPRCDCMIDARAAIRAAVAAAGVDAEEMAYTAGVVEGTMTGSLRVARILRALAEVVRDE